MTFLPVSWFFHCVILGPTSGLIPRLTLSLSSGCVLVSVLAGAESVSFFQMFTFVFLSVCLLVCNT